MILSLPSIAIAQTKSDDVVIDEVIDEGVDVDIDAPKPTVKPTTKPQSTPKPNIVNPPKTTPRITKPSNPQINDGVAPTTTSNPNALDPVELSEKADKDAQFDLLKGDLPCLDSSSSCIRLLTERAIINSPTLKGLDQQIEQNQANVKAIAAAGTSNIFGQIQPFTPFLAVPNAVLGLGTVISNVLNNLAGNARTDQTIAQNNATLQIRIAEIERSKLEVRGKIEDSVIESLIQFDSLKVEADISVAIANRESSRFKLIEIGYRLGEGDTNSFIALQNGLDRTRLAVTRNKSAMRSQAAKIKRIVLGDEG